MNKRFLSIGLGLAALFAGSQATQPTAAPQGPSAKQIEEVADAMPKAEFSANLDSKGNPVKPAKAPARVERQVRLAAAQPQELFGQVRFVERPGRRKVKYGKHRWVILS